MTINSRLQVCRWAALLAAWAGLLFAPAARADSSLQGRDDSTAIQWKARGAVPARNVEFEAPHSRRVIPASGTSPSAQSLLWRAPSSRTTTSHVSPASNETTDTPSVDPKQSPSVQTQSPAAADEHSARTAGAPQATDDPAARNPIPPELRPAVMPIARRLPAKSARARTRDAVLQVSTDAIDPADDPFGDRTGDEKAPAASEPSEPAETSAEPMPRAVEPELPSGSDRRSPSEPEPTFEPSPGDEEARPMTEEEPTRSMDLADEEQPILAPIQGEGLSCDKEKEECREAIEVLRRRDIRKIRPEVIIEGDAGQPAVEGRDFPCECTLGVNAKYLGRDWHPLTMTWKATAQCHKPLYFEDVALERYGHAWNPVLQPFVSAAHFFGSIPLLPYKMGLTPPHECMYTLGYYRPGDCAPYMIDPIPLSLRAGAAEALGVTGFVFWFWPPAAGLGGVVR